MKISGVCRALAVGFLACAAATSCEDAVAPDPVVQGIFTLSRINGRILPDTASVLKASSPGGQDCVVMRTDGQLVLFPDAARLFITVNAVNQCTGQAQPAVTESGSYSLTGRSLRLMEAFADHVDTLSGTVTDSSIDIQGELATYSFKR